jgi:hypothetical protein
VEVIDDRQTGETILDETLKMMKQQDEVEKMAINSWVDLLSGESEPLEFNLACDESAFFSVPFFSQVKRGTS